MQRTGKNNKESVFRLFAKRKVSRLGATVRGTPSHTESPEIRCPGLPLCQNFDPRE
jgi:hypothetical protein